MAVSAADAYSLLAASAAAAASAAVATSTAAVISAVISAASSAAASEASASLTGSPLRAPFMTLSFMALLVIPALKLSDRGLFDAREFRFTPALLG